MQQLFRINPLPRSTLSHQAWQNQVIPITYPHQVGRSLFVENFSGVIRESAAEERKEISQEMANIRSAFKDKSNLL